MPESPYFTLVIPTYNRADFIPKTIDSLLKQEEGDFEIIVVDDGSQDNTAEVVEGIPDPRVQYFPKKNEERAVARNTGAQMAKGKYINFFDSDDLAYPNHLAEARQVIAQFEEPELFHLGYDFKDPEGNLEREVNQFSGSLNEQLIYGNVLSCNGVFIRRDIALQYPFNPDRALSASEDYELWLRLASRFPLPYSNTITSTVINHDARSVLQVNKEKLVKRIQLLNHYLQQDEGFLQKYGKYAKLFRADLDTYVALHLAMTKQNRGEVIKYLTRSLFTYPGVLRSRRFYAAIKNWV